MYVVDAVYTTLILYDSMPQNVGGRVRGERRDSDAPEQYLVWIRNMQFMK